MFLFRYLTPQFIQKVLSDLQDGVMIISNTCWTSMGNPSNWKTKQFRLWWKEKLLKKSFSFSNDRSIKTGENSKLKMSNQSFISTSLIEMFIKLFDGGNVANKLVYPHKFFSS